MVFAVLYIVQLPFWPKFFLVFCAITTCLVVGGAFFFSLFFLFEGFSLLKSLKNGISFVLSNFPGIFLVQLITILIGLIISFCLGILIALCTILLYFACALAGLAVFSPEAVTNFFSITSSLPIAKIMSTIFASSISGASMITFFRRRMIMKKYVR